MSNNVMNRLQQFIGPNLFLKLMSLYPPYLGAGIRLLGIEGELDAITVEMKLNVFNRNYVGTQFGGSLYSMCDPWFMFLLKWKLGEPFVVWDKSATIRFLKPGKTAVRARFALSQHEVETVRHELKTIGKSEPQFQVNVVDVNGVVVASVDKGLHVHDPRMKKR